MNTACRILPSEIQSISWEDRFSDKRRLMDDSGIRAILGIASRPGVLSFAGGLPDPKLLPLRQIELCAQSVMKNHGTAALQYGVSDGEPQLLEQLSRLSQSRGADCTPSNVITTTGSQQAIDLVANALLNKGDTIVVTRPTYLGALQILSSFEPKYLEVSCDEQGPILAELESALAKRPSFFYVVSMFQNPSGVTISKARGQEIVRLCRRYDVPIIEDAAYRELFYDEAPVSLRALEAEILRAHNEHYENDGRVIYLGTLSKVMSPGLRIGWLEAPSTVIRAIACLKQGTDLHSSTMNQLIAAEFLRSYADEYWALIRQTYKERRDAAVDAVSTYIGSLARACTNPQGGFFLWLEVDPAINTNSLLSFSVEKYGVAFAPGSPFFAQNPAFNTMRISFSNLPLDKIRQGIQGLAQALTGQ